MNDDTIKKGKAASANAERPLYSPEQAMDYLDSFIEDDGKSDQAPQDSKTAEDYPHRPEPEPGSSLERVIGVLETIFDPEIPVNIYELGLIYDVSISDDGTVTLVMTLTSPHCPVAETMPMEVEYRIGCIEGVQVVNLELVWDPPWSPAMMSEAAQLELGFL
jgi:FeS assembly SUF system protein